MTKHEVSHLACKILSLYIILQTINKIINLIPLYSVEPSWKIDVYLFLPAVAGGICGAFLWFGADWLADKMIIENDRPEVSEAVSEEGESLKENQAVNIQSIAFSVVGLIFMGFSLSELVSGIVSVYEMSRVLGQTTTGWSGLVGAGIKFLAGLAIFLGARGLSGFLNRIRRIGIEEK